MLLPASGAKTSTFGREIEAAARGTNKELGADKGKTESVGPRRRRRPKVEFQPSGAMLKAPSISNLAGRSSTRSICTCREAASFPSRLNEALPV